MLIVECSLFGGPLIMHADIPSPSVDRGIFNAPTPSLHLSGLPSGLPAVSTRLEITKYE